MHYIIPIKNLKKPKKNKLSKKKAKKNVKKQELADSN